MRRRYSTAQNRAAEMIVRPIPRDGLQLAVDLWHINQQGFLVSFDGNDYFSRIVANYRSADSEGTIEIWFRTSYTASYQALLSSADTGTETSYFHLFIAGTTGKLQIETRNAGGTYNSVSGATNVADGKWHHAKLSSNGTAWDIDLDGVTEILSIEGGSNTGDWFSDITLRDNIAVGVLLRGATTGEFNGEIGFTRIYSRPVLQPEAQTNYQRGRRAAPSDTTGLVGSWDFTEGSGDTAVDTIAAENLTRTGATWVEGLTDRSPNALALSSFGSPAWSSQGRTLALNKYLLATATALNYTASDFSAWAWIKTTDLTAVNTILNRGLASTDGWGFFITAAGALTFRTNQAAANQTSFSANAAIVTDTWYLVGFTRSGATGKVWRNGVDITGTSGSHTNPLTSTRTVKIGAYDNLTLALIGTMGEADVTGRAFTAQEWQQIYLATKWRYV